MRTRRFVRFTRRFEHSSIRGYILDIGPKFFLMALVSDRFWLDGFECFRVSDVSDVRPDPYAHFAETVLQKRCERVSKKPRLSVASIEELLLSASRVFPLVTVHREQVDPGVCWIGRILSVERGQMSLLEINPDATWDEKPNHYRLSEITRVNFGGDYENALHLVGKDPNRTNKTLQTNYRRTLRFPARRVYRKRYWLPTPISGGSR
jgi:hypothetical protein